MFISIGFASEKFVFGCLLLETALIGPEINNSEKWDYVLLFLWPSPSVLICAWPCCQRGLLFDKKRPPSLSCSRNQTWQTAFLQSCRAEMYTSTSNREYPLYHYISRHSTAGFSVVRSRSVPSCVQTRAVVTCIRLPVSVLNLFWQ